MDNKKYVQTFFKKDEAQLYKEFLMAMVGIDVIVLSKEQIRDEIKFFEEGGTGLEVDLVLHNDEETKKFINIMSTFFKGLTYKLSSEPEDENFKKWLKTLNN